MVIAEYMVEYTTMNQIWFVVSPMNPLKSKEKMLPESERIEMVRLAIKDDIRFQVSNIEFEMPKPSYTISTLVRLNRDYPQYIFSLIIGMDNLVILNQWKKFKELLENYKIFVYPRVDNPEIPSFARHPAVTVINAPVIGISSTLIREALKEKKTIRQMLPVKVADYIREMKLYN